MTYSNKITFRFLTIKKEVLLKESKEDDFDSLSDYLRYIIDNRQIIRRRKNETRTTA